VTDREPGEDLEREPRVANALDVEERGMWLVGLAREQPIPFFP